MTRITIGVRDENGQGLLAAATRRSGVTINGRAGHGEDQHTWPGHDRVEFRRAAKPWR